MGGWVGEWAGEWMGGWDGLVSIRSSKGRTLLLVVGLCLGCLGL